MIGMLCLMFLNTSAHFFLGTFTFLDGIRLESDYMSDVIKFIYQ